ncbi:hypothetical protein X946_5019 [Burkholderia sp. ABCPW 111]|nr:hypothetical protein X946_5019 [Burkholderia sp. ABCPW 111]
MDSNVRGMRGGRRVIDALLADSGRAACVAQAIVGLASGGRPYRPKSCDIARVILEKRRFLIVGAVSLWPVRAWHRTCATQGGAQDLPVGCACVDRASGQSVDRSFIRGTCDMRHRWPHRTRSKCSRASMATGAASAERAYAVAGARAGLPPRAGAPFAT